MINESKYKLKLIALLLLAVIHLFYSFYISPPGHFTIDEAIYHLMVRSFSESGSLTIWNGFEEFSSRELALWNIRVHDGQLVPQYPYLYPLLATPFYRLAGFHGLFILNALSFLATVSLCFALTRKLFKDSDLALSACLIFTLATYAWMYSQAAWPHALAMFFTTGAIYLGIVALHEMDRVKSLAFAMAAGMLAGFGAGVRLDVIFVLPALIAPFLFVSPWRPWQALTSVIGIFPGLFILAATNYSKFGVASSFSYGTSAGATSGIAPYLPMMAIALIGSIGAWIWLKRPHRMLFLARKVTIALIIFVIAVAAFPSTRQMFSRLALGTYKLVIDLRISNPSIQETGLMRTPDGAMVYYGNTLKKSLLQSCPYLTILFLPFGIIRRNKKERLPLGILYLVPAIFIGIFSYFAWHGGQSFNMRYFLPALPFTSILTAYAWKTLSCGLSRKWHYISIITGILTFAGYFHFALSHQLTVKEEEPIYLTFPLILTFALFFLLLAQSAMKKRAPMCIRGASNTVLVIALTWSGLVAFCYDFSHDYAVRYTYSNFYKKASKLISSNSILFSDFPYPYFGLFDKDRVRIAVPAYDNFEDFRDLIDFHLESGRPVYMAFNSEIFKRIEKDRQLNSLSVIPLLKDQFFDTLVQVDNRPSPE